VKKPDEGEQLAKKAFFVVLAGVIAYGAAVLILVY
jgi:hypothetical protein